MAARRPPVYVHVGLPKTGTTFIQRALRANRAQLRHAGFLYPGPRVDHFFPALDLMDWDFLGHADDRTRDAWPRLVTRLREWADTSPRPALISHEVLAAATDAHVDRIVADLDFADVNLVVTLRDPARQLVAVWQETVKNRGVSTFATFFDRTARGAADPAAATSGFWPYQDAAGVLARWARHLPPERIHAATAPNPSGSGDLWSRFLRCVALDAEQVTAPISTANTSLGVPETHLLIALNKGPAADLDWPTYERTVKFLLANEVLGPRTSRTMTLTADQQAWAVEQAERTIHAVQAHVGDLQGSTDDLLPSDAEDAAPERGPEARQKDVLEAALDAIVALLRREDPGAPAPSPAAPTVVARIRSRLRRHR